MNPNDMPHSANPPTPINPEDDVKLQAIEALEARPEDLEAKPIPVVPVAPIVTPPVVVPIPIVVAEVPEPTPQPVVVIPVVPVATPVPVISTPAPVKPPIVEVKKPTPPKSAASAIAEELANNPPTRTPFQFFIRQHVSKGSLIVVFSIVAVILIGIAVYILLRPQS